jgi:hypothetical protein
MAKNKRVKEPLLLKFVGTYKKLYLETKNAQLPRQKLTLLSKACALILALCIGVVIWAFCLTSYNLMVNVSWVMMIFIGILSFQFICWITDHMNRIALWIAWDDRAPVNVTITGISTAFSILGCRIAMIAAFSLAMESNPTLPLMEISTKPPGLSSTR